MKDYIYVDETGARIPVSRLPTVDDVRERLKIEMTIRELGL